MHALCKVPDGQMPVTFSLPGFPESLHLLWLACSCCPGLAAIYELKGQRDSPAQGRPGARPRSSLASSCRLRAGSIPPLLLASGQFLPWKEMLGGGGTTLALCAPSTARLSVAGERSRTEAGEPSLASPRAIAPVSSPKPGAQSQSKAQS